MDFSFTDLFNLFDILHRASQHQALTPSERAWLKAYKGILHAVLGAVLLGLYQFFAAHTQLAGINWQVELTAFLSLAFKAYLDARGKFFTAQAPAEAQQGLFLEGIDLLTQSKGSEAGVAPS